MARGNTQVANSAEARVRIFWLTKRALEFFLPSSPVLLGNSRANEYRGTASCFLPLLLWFEVKNYKISFGVSLTSRGNDHDVPSNYVCACCQNGLMF